MNLKRARLIARLTSYGFAVALVALVITHRNDPGDLNIVPNPAPPALSQSDRLVEAHDCWTGAAPTDITMPGHVVVTLPNGVVRYGGPKLTGRAIDQLFGQGSHDPDTKLAIHGFCR